MMTTLIDVHTHLDAPHFKNDLHKVVENAVKNNVTIMVSNGTNPESNQRVLKLAGKYPEIKPALGIHPEDYLVYLGKLNLLCLTRAYVQINGHECGSWLRAQSL